MVGAMIVLTTTSGATAAFATPGGVGGAGDDAIVATGEPPVPMSGVPSTTVVIVATDDPPLPPSVATAPPPNLPSVTNVSPRNPGSVILPETGPQAQRGLIAIATLLLGGGVGLQQVAGRRRLTPVPLRARRIR